MAGYTKGQEFSSWNRSLKNFILHYNTSWNFYNGFHSHLSRH